LLDLPKGKESNLDLLGAQDEKIEEEQENIDKSMSELVTMISVDLKTFILGKEELILE